MESNIGNMNYLLSDTETTGFLKSQSDPSHPEQPHLVEIAAILADEDGKELGRVDRIIKPEGYIIPEAVVKVHGITTEKAIAEGVPLWQALWEFDRLLARADLLLFHNCLDAETEVLTPSGWVAFPDLPDGATVMQCDPLTGALSFTGPVPVVRQDFEGDLIVWDTQFHQGAYTPNHRMLISSSGVKKWKFESAGVVAGLGMNNWRVRVSGEFSGAGLGVPESWIRLAEAVRADATIVKGDGRRKGASVVFKLKKERKIKRLLKLCQEVGAATSVYAKKSHTRISLLVGDCRAFILQLFAEGKKLGPWVWQMSAEEKVTWLEEAQHWDGSRSGEHSGWSFSTADEQTATWFQIMSHTAGYRYALRKRSNQRGYSAHNENAVLWTASVRKTQKAKLLEKPNREFYKGKVYCVSVPNTAFVVRRRGVVWITGNSVFDVMVIRASHYRLNFKHRLGALPIGCTMESLTPICKLLKNGSGFKKPNMQEAHQHFFGVGFEDGHRAKFDAEALVRIFFAAKKQQDELVATRARDRVAEWLAQSPGNMAMITQAGERYTRYLSEEQAEHSWIDLYDKFQ